MPNVLYIIASVILVSLISLVGLIFFKLDDKFLKKTLLLLVSFAAGALLGDAFIHLLPEAIKENGFTINDALTILGGIVIFFILEEFIYWHHCHKDNGEKCHPFVYMNLIGDGLHNFIDGTIIAASYLANIGLGIVTTIAVVLHEIPQEVGDFAVLLRGGFSKTKALLMNLLSAAAAIVGAVLVIIVGPRIEGLIGAMLLFTVGGFIYVATADLMPELHRSKNNIYNSIAELIFFLLGIAAMLGLLLIE